MCRKEIKYITVSALFRASNDGFFLVFIALFNLFTFVTYTLTTGNPLTPNIVFTSFTLVTGLRLSTIVYMVEGVLGFQQARVALRRIQVCYVRACTLCPLCICMYLCIEVCTKYIC